MRRLLTAIVSAILTTVAVQSASARPALRASAKVSAAAPAGASIGFINGRSALGANDSVDWSIVGPPFTAVPYDFSVVSPGGTALSVSIFKVSDTPPYVFQTGPEPLPATAFADGDFILFTGGENPAFPGLENPSPITITFAQPVYGVGAQLQPDDECPSTCPYTGTFQVFDKRNRLLGTLTSPGTSSRALDNSATFFGVLSKKAQIAKIVFDIDPKVSGLHPISINALSLTTTKPRIAGAVYALTNEASGNYIAAYDRTDTGALIPAGSFATGGLGIGDGTDGEGLGSQGALQLSPDKNYLYAVNAGSNDISVLKVGRRGLSLIQRISSGGTSPISLTLRGKLLYVLNYQREEGGGGEGEGDDCGGITGFTVFPDGHLSPLLNSSRPLSACGSNPGQVGFNPSGTLLAVTEKATSVITSYTVGSNGLPSAPIVSPAISGTFPFSLAFNSKGLLLVTDDFNDASKAGGASSFKASPDGHFTLVSGSIPTLNTATCWVVITGDDRYAYVTNTNDGNISGYSLSSDGVLALLNPSDGITAVTGPSTKPRDLAFSSDYHYLYTLNSLSGTIFGYAVNADGSLSQISQVGGLPLPGLNGLAAY